MTLSVNSIQPWLAIFSIHKPGTLDGLVNKVGWQNNSLILAPNLSVICVNNKILASDWFSATLVYKGNGTDSSPVSGGLQSYK